MLCVKCAEVLVILVAVHIHCHMLRRFGGAAAMIRVCFCAAVHTYLLIA